MLEKKENEKQMFSTDAKGVKKLSVEVLMRTLIQRCMGKALDYARISGMADRSLAQFERSVKDDFYMIIDDGSKILKEYGYSPDAQK